jgi:hypothetical protein
MGLKFLPILLISMAFALPVDCQTKAIEPCKFLSSAEAEKILGQPVELTENVQSVSNGKTTFRCTYRRIENDKITGREVNLYFMLEESLNEEQAKQIYKEIWDGNKKHEGIKVLNGIGNEAYSHSDKPNFHFILARKGKFTVRMKVNKAVEGTSLDELKAFAKRVVEQI